MDQLGVPDHTGTGETWERYRNIHQLQHMLLTPGITAGHRTNIEGAIAFLGRMVQRGPPPRPAGNITASSA